MKYYIIIFKLVLVFIQTLSQEFSLIKGKSDIDLGSTNIHKIFANDDSFFYVLKHYGNQFYIAQFDNLMNKIEEKPVKLYEGLKSFELESIIYFHGKIYVFASRRTFNSKKLYFKTIDKKTLKSDVPFNELIDIKYIKGNWADLYFTLSRSETKLLIACITKVFLSKIQYNEFYVFDKDLSLVWSIKDFYEYKGQGPRDNIFVVDDYNNVSILSLIKRQSIFTYLFSEEKNLYNIYRYTENGKTFKSFPITLKEKFIKSIKITDDNEGNLICCGLYSDLLRPGIKGIFFIKISNENSNIIAKQLNELPLDFLEKIKIFKEPFIEEDELMKYEVTDVVPRKNNTITLIAEQIFEQNYDTYNTLIISNLNVDGNINWITFIPKRQSFSDISYLDSFNISIQYFRDLIRNTGQKFDLFQNLCSYALLSPIEGNDIVIIYNDHIKNLKNPEKIKSFGHHRKSILIAVHIDEYGNLKYIPLKQWQKKLLYPEPIRYYATLKNTIIIPAFKGRKYYYYKIDFNNLN